MLDGVLVGLRAAQAPAATARLSKQLSVLLPSALNNTAFKATTTTKNLMLGDQPHTRPLPLSFRSTTLWEGSAKQQGEVNIACNPAIPSIERAACSPLPEQPSQGGP